jgi:hypothetical protein
MEVGPLGPALLTVVAHPSRLPTRPATPNRRPPYGATIKMARRRRLGRRRRIIRERRDLKGDVPQPIDADMVELPTVPDPSFLLS